MGMANTCVRRSATGVAALAASRSSEYRPSAAKARAHAYGRSHRMDRTRILRRQACDDRLRIRSRERRLTGEHLIEHGADRMDVGACVDVPLTARLLGAHVRRCAERHARPRECRDFPVAAAGDAEIRDEGAPVARQEEILRLDVAVHHAVLVRVRETAGCFNCNPQGFVDWKLRLATSTVAQALAVDIRHGVPEPPVRVTGDVGRLAITVVH